MENIKQRRSRLAVFEHVPHKEKEKHSHRSRYADRRFNGLKRSRTPSDSELVIDDDDDKTIPKKRRQGVRLTQEVLNLQCDWINCSKVINDYKEFIEHVISHNLELSNCDSFECVWDGCSYIALNEQTLLQHLYFHGYHTKLKNIGTNLLERTKLPKCNHWEQFTIPDVLDGFVCRWEDCYKDCENIYGFLEHMKIHIWNNPKYCKDNEIIECNWKGCSSKFSSQYKLCDHLRSHTKEKVIACPTCGNLFSSKTKFYDHRKRQLSIETEMQSYQCSQCMKLFGSERLLRDHMSIHINHYKCTMCDMTCPKRSALAQHIRYRHLTDRPFKCHLCDHTSITKTDLDTHMFTHEKGNDIACEFCDFRCRTNFALDRHTQIKHGDGYTPLYACHCCDKRLCTGGGLTKHLIKVHDFHWPSGHSRFRYKADPEDGLYRLQTVRYESIEVTQEMITNNTKYQPSNSAESYKLHKIRDDTRDQTAAFCFVSVEDTSVPSDNQNLQRHDSANADDSEILSMSDELRKSPAEWKLQLNAVASSDSEMVQFTNIIKLDQDNVISGTEKLEGISGGSKTIVETDNNIYITIDQVDEEGNIVKSEMIKSNEIFLASTTSDSDDM